EVVTAVRDVPEAWGQRDQTGAATILSLESNGDRALHASPSPVARIPIGLYVQRTRTFSRRLDGEGQCRLERPLCAEQGFGRRVAKLNDHRRGADWASHVVANGDDHGRAARGDRVVQVPDRLGTDDPVQVPARGSDVVPAFVVEHGVVGLVSVSTVRTS